MPYFYRPGRILENGLCQKKKVTIFHNGWLQNFDYVKGLDKSWKLYYETCFANYKHYTYVHCKQSIRYQLVIIVHLN